MGHFNRYVKAKSWFSALVILLNMVWSFSLFAQGKNVTGVVKDGESGDPLVGVSVLVKGTSKGVVTDLDGAYSIQDVSTEDVLMFSYLGYSMKEIPIGSRSVIDVELVSNTSDLDEVVIVGYGVQEKRNLTGAIASVGSEEVRKTNVQDPISLLQGRAAGVQVTSNSGAPGGGMTINIRGLGQ